MKTYTGHCHCGAVTFEAEVDLEKPVISCNCSLCSMRGWMLTFIPATQFKLLSGEDNLTEYRFGKEHIKHLFCSTCGVQCFGRGEGPNGPTVALNILTLEGVDQDSLTINKFNGKDL